MALTKIPASFLDKSSHVDFANNEKLRFGAGADLHIYHDGSHSYIDELVTGDLRIRSNSAIALLKSSDNADMLLAVPDGAVSLYYAGAKKLETASTGASVTGNLAVSGNLTVSGTTTELDTTNLNVTDKNITLNYHASSDTSSNADGAGITIQDAVDASNDATLTWNTSLDKFDLSHGLHIGSSAAIGSATTPALQIGGTTTYRLGMYTDSEGAFIENKNGDDGINFLVKTAGQAMRIDGGTGNVGIGTNNPTSFLSNATALEISGGTGVGSELILTNNSSMSANEVVGSLIFKNTDGSGSPNHFAGLRAKAEATYGRMYLEFYAGRSRMEGGTPDMVITPNGADAQANVGIGTDS